jgi:GAF domain-containing protein
MAAGNILILAAVFLFYNGLESLLQKPVSIPLPPYLERKHLLKSYVVGNSSHDPLYKNRTALALRPNIDRFFLGSPVIIQFSVFNHSDDPRSRIWGAKADKEKLKQIPLIP